MFLTTSGRNLNRPSFPPLYRDVFCALFVCENNLFSSHTDVNPAEHLHDTYASATDGECTVAIHSKPSHQVFFFSLTPIYKTYSAFK